MVSVTRLTALCLFGMCMGSANAASWGAQWSISVDDFARKDGRLSSATPFDPTSWSRDSLPGNTTYSSRRVAIELMLHAARVRHADSLVYRRAQRSAARVTYHWRLRASTRRFLVRYEIRF